MNKSLMHGILTTAVLIAGLVFVSCDNEIKKWEVKDFPPEESEYMEFIWMGSPTYENKAGWSSLETQVQMIKAMLPAIKIKYAVNEQADIDNLVTALLDEGVSQDTIDARIQFHTIEHGDVWFRDMGGIFLRKNLFAKGEYEGLAMLDFGFNGWGYGLYSDAVDYSGDDQVASVIAKELKIPVIQSDLIAEGGALQFNGHGTLMVTEYSLIDRNPGWTKSLIEAELRRVANVEKIIWIPKVLGTDAHAVEDDPYFMNNEYVFAPLTVGHIDNMAIWIDRNTVALGEVDPADTAGNVIAKKNFEALEAAYQVLSQSTDQDGLPINIVRMPDPGFISETLQPGDGVYDYLATLSGVEHFPADGSPVKVYLAASYLNFVVANNVVLVPKFYKTGRDPKLLYKDSDARNTLATLFPGRTIVQIEIDAIAVGGGGMHCITQHQPALK